VSTSAEPFTLHVCALANHSLTVRLENEERKFAKVHYLTKTASTKKARN
jgi:hypothetical protein